MSGGHFMPIGHAGEESDRGRGGAKPFPEHGFLLFVLETSKINAAMQQMYLNSRRIQDVTPASFLQRR
jgi:hypothetical protein